MMIGEQRDSMSELRCPRCAAALSSTPDTITCSGCGGAWPVTNGIPRFIEANGYWGEIPRPEALSLNLAASHKGWRQAVSERFAGNRDMLLSLLDWQRASWLPLLALPNDAVALDIGSGYGAITQSLSHAAAKVYSLEAIAERIEFTSVRLAQEAIDNVQLIQGTALQLPFMNEGFDLIVVNGVLEWIGAWRTEGDPRAVQLEFLRSLRKLLKPDGVLVIGIENRFSFDAMCGGIDHSGVSYTSLMPRRLASMYLRRRRGAHYRTSSDRAREYRTYTYSQRGYTKLLGTVGFEPEFYWPYPGYNEPSCVMPLDNVLVHEQLLANITEPPLAAHGGWRARLKRLAAATGLLRLLVPDFLILATKTGRPRACARLRTHLNPALVPDQAADTSRVSLCGGHFAMKTVIRVYAKGSDTPQLVLKASTPARGSADATLDEHRKLALVVQRAQERCARFSVPRPLGSFQAANYQYTAESTADGEPLSRLLFLRPRRGRLAFLSRELPRCADLVIDVARVLEHLTDVEDVPATWCRPFREHRTDASTYPSCVQHGDLTIENILLQPRNGAFAVIDWQHLVRGVPPLYDCFTLMFSVLPAVPAERLSADPSQARFLTAFFSDGPWARLFRDVIVTVAGGLQVPHESVWGMFLEFLVIRAHFHESRDRENSPPVGLAATGLAHVYASYLGSVGQYSDRFLLPVSRSSSGALSSMHAGGA